VVIEIAGRVLHIFEMHALEITDLRKTYGNGVEALKGISLSVEEGDFFALLGPNGAGKSTLIGIISSLVNATSGEARVFGTSVQRDRSRAMSCIGLVPQELNFNQFERPLEIVVNQAGYYGIPRETALTRAEKYLKQLNLWDKADKPSRTLSGGMKRRLMIARAMVNEPRLLILDEPTSGLDPEAALLVRSFIQELRHEGRVILLTTHNLDEADRLCDRIAVFKTRLLALDSPGNLRRTLFERTVVFHLTEVRPQYLESLRSLDYIHSADIIDNKLVVTLDDPETYNPQMVSLLVAPLGIHRGQRARNGTRCPPS